MADEGNGELAYELGTEKVRLKSTEFNNSCPKYTVGAKSIEKNLKSNMMKLLWRVISFEREMVSQADKIKRECVFVCTKCSQSYILFFCAIYRKKGKKQQFMPVKCHWCQRY